MAFKSRAVRALVLIQMDELRQLFVVWRKAKRVGVILAATKDPDYRDLDALMHHPLRASRGYLTWLCEVLNRRDPRVPDQPEAADVAKQGAAYIELLDTAWQKHMAWMTTSGVYSRKVHTSRWGHPMTVEGMLEHALAHPMRHRFQLEELIATKGKRTKAKRGVRR